MNVIVFHIKPCFVCILFPSCLSIACPLCPGCLKPRPITATDDEYNEVQDRSVQFQECPKQEPSIFNDDSLSVQSYEFLRTMDIGCECKVERKNDELDGTDSNYLIICQQVLSTLNITFIYSQRSIFRLS